MLILFILYAYWYDNKHKKDKMIQYDFYIVGEAKIKATSQISAEKILTQKLKEAQLQKIRIISR